MIKTLLLWINNLNTHVNEYRGPRTIVERNEIKLRVTSQRMAGTRDRDHLYPCNTGSLSTETNREPSISLDRVCWNSTALQKDWLWYFESSWILLQCSEIRAFRLGVESPATGFGTSFRCDLDILPDWNLVQVDCTREQVAYQMLSSTTHLTHMPSVEINCWQIGQLPSRHETNIHASLSEQDELSRKQTWWK